MAAKLKEYKLSAYVLLLGIWLIFNAVALWAFVIFVAFMYQRPDFILVVIFYIVVMVYTSSLLFLIFHKDRLQISTDGIAYQRVWFTTYAKWSDIKGVQRQAFGQTSLILDKFVFKKNPIAWWTLFYLAPFAKWGAKYIPLGTLMWEKSDEIEAEVRKKAPHLFG